MRPASVLRRLAAYGIDYLLIMAWAGGLFALSSRFPDSWFATANGAHLTSFLVLTLPVVLYFALTEGSAWHATVGKKLLGLRVRVADAGAPTMANAFTRNVTKFLPWELAHAFVHRAEVWPEAVNVAGGSLAMALFAAFAAPILFTASRRAVWDRVAGTEVTGPAQSGQA